MSTTRGIVARRPAETAAGGLGVGGIITGIATHNALAASLAAIGLLPGAISYLKDNGGLRGLWRAIVGTTGGSDA